MDHIIPLLTDPNAWVALFMLTIMEVILGIDNLIFVAVLSNKLPEKYRAKARMVGLSLALFMRLFLLAGIAWIVTLTTDVIVLFGQGFSWRDFIMLGGGLFLIWKATMEIHESLEPHKELTAVEAGNKVVKNSFMAAIVQIIILDLVFSLDSIITAVGMTHHVPVMIVAVIIAVGTMLLASGTIARFIEKHPTIVMLALSFLLMIGTVLVAEGLGFHVPKGYVYFAMGFCIFVEMLNMVKRKRHG